MDTNRLQIINIDSSAGTPVVPASIKALTVLRAPKGPIKPVYLGKESAFIREIVGAPSVSYPEIQEALDFVNSNDDTGIYISAPYDEAADNKVSVAYVTPVGVVKRQDLINISGSRIEEVETGEALITGITSVSGPVNTLVPVGTAKSLFNVGADVGESGVLTYDTNTLSIHTGVNLDVTTGELANTATTLFQPINTAAFDEENTLQVMRNGEVASAGILVFDIPGASELLEVHIKIDGTALRLTTPGDLEIGESIAGVLSITGGTSLPGEYNTYFSTSALASFWNVSDKRAKVKVYWKASTKASAIYATLYQKYLSNNTTVVSSREMAIGNRFDITISEGTVSSPLEFSIDTEETKASGESLSYLTKFPQQSLLAIHVLKMFEAGTLFPGTGTTEAPRITFRDVVLSRGERTVNDAAIQKGWQEAADPEYSDVDIFFNPAPLTEANQDDFLTLHGVHKLSRLIATKTVTPAEADGSLSQLTFGERVYMLTNLFRRANLGNALTGLTGSYANMIAHIIEVKLGGAAPMYVNDGAGCGGQLRVTGTLSPLYRYNRAQQTALDNANYNPVVNDSNYGIMVIGQKTCQAGEITDWSYVGHSSAFLAFQKQVRQNIMIPQLGKPNNPRYRELRGMQLDSLIRARTEGSGRIWASAIGDTTSLNSRTETLQARKFIFKVTVKVDIFSEGVVLIFENVGQDTNI